MAFGTVMKPAGLDEVSSLFIREERSRSGVVLEIRKQVDDGQPKICGERKDAVVISRILSRMSEDDPICQPASGSTRRSIQPQFIA